MRFVASKGERAEALAGDHLLAADHVDTAAVSLEGAPSEVWPWLVQMGHGRAGWYAWDALDNGGVPSAAAVLPEFQGLAIGDSISARPGGGRLEVVLLIPDEALVYRTEARKLGMVFAQSWAFVLRPEGAGTRLIVRNRARWSRPLGPAARLLFRPMHGLMQRRQLASLRRLI